MKKVLKLICIFVSMLMCSCSQNLETETATNVCPPVLNIQYYFEKNLSKDEAYEYIQGIESMREVTSTIPLSNMPTENYSSNFLQTGTKLYMVDEGIIAITDDEEDFYAALLVVHIE